MRNLLHKFYLIWRYSSAIDKIQKFITKIYGLIKYSILLLTTHKSMP